MRIMRIRRGEKMNMKTKYDSNGTSLSFETVILFFLFYTIYLDGKYFQSVKPS